MEGKENEKRTNHTMEVVDTIREVATKVRVLEVQQSQTDLQVSRHATLIDAINARQSATESLAIATREAAIAIQKQSEKQDGQILHLQQQAVDVSKIVDSHERDIKEQTKQLESLNTDRDNQHIDIIKVARSSFSLIMTVILTLIIGYLFAHFAR